MNATKLVGLLLGFVLAFAVGAQPAGAVKLVDFTIEPDKEVYQVGEFMFVTYYAYNAGDEGLYISGDHFPPAAAWVFENAAELSRDDLLSQQEPISTRTLCVCDEYPPLCPGETLTGTGGSWYLRDDLGDPIAPGQYTLLGVEGPFPEYWDGATVDYSNARADITIVPEPGTLCLLLLGGVGPVLLRRNRRQGSEGPSDRRPSDTLELWGIAPQGIQATALRYPTGK